MGAVSAFVSSACGSRGPLDIDVINVIESGDGGQATSDASVDALVDAPQAPARDAPADAPRDATAKKEAGLVDCGLCVVQQCGAPILACVQSAVCRSTLQCAATTCLKGGAPDLACVLTCAKGDSTTLQQLVGVFGCITVKCGNDCTSVLGGLGGLGGGGNLQIISYEEAATMEGEVVQSSLHRPDRPAP